MTADTVSWSELNVENGQYDDFARLAAQICAAPVALVSVVEAGQQVPRASIGIQASVAPLEEVICQYTIAKRDLLVIPDLAADARTTTHPLVTANPAFRFYAGVFLAGVDGKPLGTLCVMDRAPRPQGLTDDQAGALAALGRQVVTLLDLQRERSRFEAVFNSAVDYAIIVINRDGKITDWNEGAHQILGWTPEEICGRDLDVFFTPEDRKAGISDKEMESARVNGRGIDERWHLRKNGDRFWASGEMMPLRGPDGELQGYVKMLRDRTEVRLADERLEMALTASGAVGLWDWMVDTDLLHGDAHFARLYGLDAARTNAGLTMEEYQLHVVEEDIAPLRAKIREVFDAGADFLVEYRLAIPGERLRWVECKGRMVHDQHGEPVRFSGTAVDVTGRKDYEEQRQLLMHELSHRVKNTFAMVQSVAFQTLRGTDQAVSMALQSRLAALSRAHEVLVQTSWSSTTLAELMERVLRLEAEGERFRLTGPDLLVGSRAALSLSLLLHELATNAVKYGSLSVPQGFVRIEWCTDGDTFCLSWREEGGPPATASTRTGFGSRLIGMGIAGARQSNLDYTEAGLRAVFHCPRTSLEQD
ncbi:PAS domain S-box protein [Sphingomonas sp. TREG-RG-20F-R18-01]|uniref:PAS domain S-box protein n=1 Tax=Sphingomonas sp. TREG-RG-20F-R18-01 TaxID=2914982 RepID=UPI001F560D9D|nr:PAS domain S-box protein [Sphingomonas sp. TREG-RG-20F-R18-01]